MAKVPASPRFSTIRLTIFSLRRGKTPARSWLDRQLVWCPTPTSVAGAMFSAPSA